MAYGIRLHVWGNHACFTRPEMKVERVTYDVMTPSAARGILDAIHWKPAIRWQVERIHVLRPIRHQTIRRNEVASVVPARNVRRAMAARDTSGLRLVSDHDRVQRAATVLRDVAYVIEATFRLTGRAGAVDTAAKHYDTFTRRATKGQCHHRPCLGTREFAAEFRLVGPGEPLPESTLPQDQREQDLGWMLLDLDFHDDEPGRAIEPKFFRARLSDGIVHVPPMDSVEARS